MRYLLIKNIIFNGSVKRRNNFFCSYTFRVRRKPAERSYPIRVPALWRWHIGFCSQHFHFFRGAFSSAYF